MSTMYQEGYQAYSNREYPAAIEALIKVVEVDEAYDNGNALYYLAQAYRKNDDMESAKAYYQKVVDLFPGTERATTSQNYLDTAE